MPRIQVVESLVCNAKRMTRHILSAQPIVFYRSSTYFTILRPAPDRRPRRPPHLRASGRRHKTLIISPTPRRRRRFVGSRGATTKATKPQRTIVIKARSGAACACVGRGNAHGLHQEGDARLWVYSLYDPLVWTSTMSLGKRTHGIESGRGTLSLLCNGQAMFALKPSTTDAHACV